MQELWCEWDSWAGARFSSLGVWERYPGHLMLLAPDVRDRILAASVASYSIPESFPLHSSCTCHDCPVNNRVKGIGTIRRLCSACLTLAPTGFALHTRLSNVHFWMPVPMEARLHPLLSPSPLSTPIQLGTWHPAHSSTRSLILNPTFQPSHTAARASSLKGSLKRYRAPRTARRRR